MPQRVPVDPHTGGFGGQLTRPHHRHTHLAGQPQPTLADREPAAGVLQRGQRLSPRLEDGLAPPLDPVGVVERGSVGAQRLLLGDLGSYAQPCRLAAGRGEQLGQFTERGLAPGFLLADGLVPEEPAAVPLLAQRPLGLRARPQPVGVAHGLLHTGHHPVHPRHFPDRAGDRPRGAPNGTRPSNGRRCPATCTCSSRLIRGSASTGWSHRSRAARRSCSVRSSRSCGPGCPRSGPTPTSCHGRRRHLGGRQAPSREPTQRLGRSLLPPHG
jgi:hypothetical protein